MLIEPVSLTFRIRVLEDEQFTLPPALIESIGPGEWLITVQPLQPRFDESQRDHAAFLNSYALEDDLLYADLASG